MGGGGGGEEALEVGEDGGFGFGRGAVFLEERGGVVMAGREGEAAQVEENEEERGDGGEE